MNIKTIAVTFCALASLAVFAADNSASTNTPAKVKLPRGMKRYGGIIQVPNSQKGTIAIINAQKKLPIENLRAGMDEFAKMQKFNVKFIDGAATTPENASADMKKTGADIAVFLQENPGSSVTVLTAPEQRWTILNITAITADARNDVFAAARTRKEIIRGFLCAAGAMNSQYPGSMMAAIKEPKDLDKLIEDPPVDAIQRAIEAMKVYGVTPQESTTYKKACQQGWAPAPINEWQQAIWDETRQLPANPIKIQYDKAKGK